MKISYDYEEMIQELKEEISSGTLSLTDTIQILRSDKVINNGYKVIIDWYYDNDLEADMFNEEQSIKEKRQIKKHLESILVANCLLEMEMFNKII